MEILFPSRRLSHHRFLFVGACIQKSPDTQPLTPWPLGITRLYLSSQAHRLLIPPLKRSFELLCRGGLPRVGKSLSGARPCTSGLGEDRNRQRKGWGHRTLSSELMEGEPGHTPMSLHPGLCSLIVGTLTRGFREKKLISESVPQSVAQHAWRQVQLRLKSLPFPPSPFQDCWSPQH